MCNRRANTCIYYLHSHTYTDIYFYTYYILLRAWHEVELDDVDSHIQIVAARNDKLTAPAHSYGHWLIAIYLQISRVRAFTRCMGNPQPIRFPFSRQNRGLLTLVCASMSLASGAEPSRVASHRREFCSCGRLAALTQLVVCHLLRTALTPTA